MRVIAPLAFALSIGALGACDSLGRSVLGGPGPVIPHDDGVDGIDATSTMDVPVVRDIQVPMSDVEVTCEGGQRAVNGACVMDGLLTFTLRWDLAGDVDLHVVTPGGAEIYYDDRMGDDGVLDRDDTMGTGPENIYWAIPPPPGDYVVCVVPFRLNGPTNFQVDVRGNGMTTTWTGTRTESTGNLSCTSASDMYVGTYTVAPDVPDM